jgi:hypothetical protein
MIIDHLILLFKSLVESYGVDTQRVTYLTLGFEPRLVSEMVFRLLHSLRSSVDLKPSP